MSGSSKGIVVYDRAGIKRVISREKYRDSVLPLAFSDHWNDADGLYGVLLYSLQDGFFAESLSAAEHLCEIDPSLRAAMAYANALLKCERPADAERFIDAALSRYGDDATLLTHLASAYAYQGRDEAVEPILWRALRADPNDEHALKWLEVLRRERGGDAASRAVVSEIASLPGSWLAQLFMARWLLAERKFDDAAALYDLAIERAGKPVPADLLMQMSGDLGNAGRSAEAIARVEPLYDVAVHGPMRGGFSTGYNLMQSHVDVGDFDGADRIIQSMYALKRPDWRETLDLHFASLVEARKRSGEDQSAG